MSTSRKAAVLILLGALSAANVAARTTAVAPNSDANANTASAPKPPKWRPAIERRFDIEQSGDIAVLVQFAVNPGRERERSLSTEGALNTVRATNVERADAFSRQLSSQGIMVLQAYDYVPYVLVRIKSSDLDILAKMPEVISVSPNLEMRHDQRKVPDNKFDQPAASIDDVERERPQLSVSTNAIKARDAWARGYDGAGQVIAILDDGIYSAHEMFQSDGIVLEACFSGGGSGQSLCPNGLRQVKNQTGAASLCSGGNGVCEHGTHVAGIAMGYTKPWVENSKNSTNTHLGVAPQAYVLPIQVFSRKTSGCTGSDCIVSNSSDELAALNYLIEVVNQKLLPASRQLVAANMSLGGDPDYGDYCYDDPLASAIKILRQLNVLTTIASGNDSTNDRVTSPACIKQGITVDASTRDHTRGVTYSNSSRAVDIIAPGGSSSSAVISAGVASPTSYVGKTGTSMAAPHVAGAIAILRSKSPNATADEVEWAIKKSATRSDVYNQEYKEWSEYYIDVNAALDVLGEKPALGVPIAGYYPDSFAGGFNYARVYNPNSSSGTVNITLVRDDTGEVLGSSLQTIPARSAVQIQVSSLQNSIGGSALTVPGTTTLSAYFDASFLGYAQNILWNAGAQSLTNITSCADNQPDFNDMLGNVHTALIDAAYPSSIRIHNKGSAAARAVFDIYNSATGGFLGTWTTPDVISPNTTKTYSAMTAYTTIGFKPDANTFHAAFILKSDPNFVLGHIVNNVGANLMTDMTPKCRI